MDSRPEAGHTAVSLGGDWRNTMSKIHITFDDLCAFFTSKLVNDNLLMVGMIQNQASDQNDIHEPIIEIREQGQVVKRYKGFDEIQGKVSLDVYGADNEPTAPSIQVKAQLDAGQVPFNKIPDLEDHLYKGQPLTVKAALCKARLYFQHGELYAEGRTRPFDFYEVGTTTPRSGLRLDNVPDQVAIDIALPTDGHAELCFENGTLPFCFDDGKDYDVKITNIPPNGSKDSSHFLHFYEIVENMRYPRLLPMRVFDQDVGPFCVESRFSKADFDSEESPPTITITYEVCIIRRIIIQVNR
jgi:hypothetical protein